MSVRKYRLYLLLITLVLGIAGAVFYYTKQEKTYRDGTLVENVYVPEEMLL